MAVPDWSSLPLLLFRDCVCVFVCVKERAWEGNGSIGVMDWFIIITIWCLVHLPFHSDFSHSLVLVVYQGDLSWYHRRALARSLGEPDSCMCANVCYVRCKNAIYTNKIKLGSVKVCSVRWRLSSAIRSHGGSYHCYKQLHFSFLLSKCQRTYLLSFWFSLPGVRNQNQNHG